MEWHDIEVEGRHTVKFSELPYVPLTCPPPQSLDEEECIIDDKLGGIIRYGEWAWLARNSMLQIVSLRNGQTISSYEFCEQRGYESCCIKYVEEIFPYNQDLMLLAVIMESFRGPGGGSSYVALYSVELGCVLSSIELGLRVTCARFMNSSACRRTLLQNYDGCLAIGSDEGVVVLLDLNIQKVMSKNCDFQEDCFVPCHIVQYNLSLTEIHRSFRQCQQDEMIFGLQMEVIESPCSVRSILPIDVVLGLAIGLEDGRLILYDLAELQIFYVAIPTSEVAMSAIVKMDFLEPPDDPRPCLYVWTLHENGTNLHAILHSLMYEKRLIEKDSCKYFETFQSSYVRLQLPLEATKSVALACQAISTLSSHGEEDSNCLCVISWLSVLEGKNKLLLFDLNQWYKEEMPQTLDYGRHPNYLAGYILNGECSGLHTLINPNAISHFNSMQRFEEHFYPNSLSFECSLLYTEGCRRYNWEGAQNRVINLLRSSNAAIFLEPNFYFNEVMRTRLMPQFIELSMTSTYSRDAKYEILLSTALEHNCVSLLRDCAKSWVDGSFMGNFSASTGLSLSTMTDWIWKRATSIKARCNNLCKSLFDFGGYPLDNREQKELGFITRQLKLLSDLLKEILIYAKKQIPETVYSDLENKYKSLCMAANYHDILLWLFNIGLLPEASPYNNKTNFGNELVPYPYKELKEFYRQKRSFFAKRNESFVSKKTGSCRLLYIDAFIDHVCKGNILREYWLENDGDDGLYPPNSLEAMLRIMLVPDLEYDNKCAILLYFFLDLNMSIDEEAYKHVVANFIKFPSVFKLSASLIKTVQAFWNLDHDNFLPAVDEFISPINKNQSYPQWQVELLIEVLLNKNVSNLALRILESESHLTSPCLKLKTLLANELISEAFHFVRSKNDDLLLEKFFSCCLTNGQFGVIRDLALSEKEGLILQNILKNTKVPCAESLHFVYLLQKSKYIEAVSYMDELSSKSKITKSSLNQIPQVDTPNLVLSAFNTTMTPVTQGLTDVYFRIKNKIKKKEINNKSPVPLSCQLIKQNANSLLGGIYHSSALSVHFASYYWGEIEEETKKTKHLLSSNNAPFLRKPQIDANCIDYLEKNNISYPQPYKINDKRTLIESEYIHNKDNECEKHKIENKLNPKKKRRLIGQEIVDDISNFLKTNKPSSNLNVTEFQFGPEYTNKQNLEQIENPLLTTPVLTKQTRSNKVLEENVSTHPEIHGILKTNTTEIELNHREPIVEEEKNIRFRLPSTDLDNTQVEESQHEVVEEMEIIQDANQTKDEFPGLIIPKRREITRAVSEESNKSSVSSDNQSEDNFYSPLSSQNNSKLDISNLSKYSGPQPRKPLDRLSAERSENALASDGKVSNTSSFNNASNLGYTTAAEESSKIRICARSSLDNHLDKCAEKTNASNREDDSLAYASALNTFTDKFKVTQESSCFENIASAATISCKKVNDGNASTYVTELKYLPIKPEVSQGNSGFGNITSQTISSGSKINEFLPKDSSSKVDLVPLKPIEENKQTSPVGKLLECSTVIGSLTNFECTNTGSRNVFAMPTMPLDKTNSLSSLNKPTEEQKRQMLETTLGMSNYDLSTLESSSVQQSKSLVVSAKDDSLKMESNRGSSVQNTEEENKEQTAKEQMKHYDENIKDDQCKNKESTSTNYNYKEDFNDDCIVLSSSSSTSPSHTDQKDYDEDSNKSSDMEEEQCEVHSNCDNDTENFNSTSETDIQTENESDLSMGATENNQSDTENEDIIQLVDDSSADTKQELTNYCNESNSDDVKLIEESDINVDVNDTKNLGENKEMTHSEIGKDNSFLILNVHDYEKEIEDRNVAQNSEEISLITENKDSNIEIQINESIRTATTESIHKEILAVEADESKCEELFVMIDKIKDKQNGGCDNDANKEGGKKSPIECETEPKDNEQETIVKNKSELQENKVEEAVIISTPHKQLRIKASSLSLKDEDVKDITDLSSRRSTRGISVPPQTIIESEEFSTHTPTARRRARASSLQPNYKIEDNPDLIGTPKRNKSLLDKDNLMENTLSTRGSSVLHGTSAGKVSTRRRSALLDAINEDSTILDSPSSRTRLRTRLNSMDSEIESPIVSALEHSSSAKRTRRGSISSSVSESQLTRNKRRRSSISSQPEVTSVRTPRTLRARSVVSVQEDKSESMSDLRKPQVSKIIGLKRKKTIKEEKSTENLKNADNISPKSDHTTMSEASYSTTTRRLTRTQLAIMEKSAALSQATTQDAMSKDAITISPPPNKRSAKARTTRSSNAQHDSDDTESVSSKISTTSSVNASRRRVTRSTTKDNDDDDDDVTSIASSIGSEKRHRRRPSKDKSSPNNSKLAAIPEDAPVETKKRGRSTKN